MTLFLRTTDNRSLAEVEIYIDTEEESSHVEVSSAVYIDNYSYYLIANYKIGGKTKRIIDIFDEISELRGWLWEVYLFPGNNTPDRKGDVENEVQKKFESWAKELNLMVVED